MTTIPADKLDKLVARWQTVQGTLAAGADQESYVRLSREFAELDPDRRHHHRAAQGAPRERDDLQQLIDDPAVGRRDGRARGSRAWTRSTPRSRSSSGSSRCSLLPKDAADEKSAILEVRAGTGGEEAALFAGDLFRMYQRYADRHGWKVAIISASESATGGYKEIIANITGKGVFARLKFESGVHRVQRVPETEAQGRIHTSAATVAVLPEAEEVDIKIEDKDLRIDVFRASGPGGQSVNTTDSAVRITHMPIGPGGQPAGREVAAQEQGQGDEGAARAALRAGARQARCRARPRTARARSAPATAPSASAPTISRKAASPITASASPRTSSPYVLEGGEALDEIIDALITEHQTTQLAAMQEEANA